MVKFSRKLLTALVAVVLLSGIAEAQVNAVEFGRNRVQFKKFKWQYYQTRNFNTYFNQNGQELAKFVLQVAEEELPGIEAFTEYSLQRRANIVVYNEYADFQQSNIGLGTDWQNTDGTKFVNNKMVVYFNGDHAHLRKQIRQGIARVLIENLLFGDDLGEIASNQNITDLPKWLTEGYINYTAENWSTELDDELKAVVMDGNYTKFNRFAFEQPRLAGHAFWYFISEKYKKENVTYFLYLARVYKSLNRASMQVCKKKFKALQAEFFEYEEEKYSNDNRRRKPYPKGSVVESFDINQRQDYYRINVNPNKKNNTYAVVEYKKGIVKLKLSEDFDFITLLKYGVRSYKKEVNPDYPITAWDPKGTRLTVIYQQEGRLKLFVYDLVTRIKYPKLDLTDKFQQIQDVKYMLDSRTLLISASKNGHTDIFTLNLENEKVQQITNDVYDDLDASFVAFPGKTGIIFASNRPGPYAKNSDTALPSKNRYNIYLITNFGVKPELNQITQLSNLKYGNARFPTPYNSNHFTFVSDENGIGNRYAGFFTTKAAGVDTLILIGTDILRNPSQKDIDSTLKAYKKTEYDSMAVVTVTEDSTYTFPLSNYESGIAESRVAGDLLQVSEVTKTSEEKVLYKLKIDENTLRRRNITAVPTTYMRKMVMADKILNTGDASNKPPVPASDTASNVFQNEFDNEKPDSSLKGLVLGTTNGEANAVLQSAKLYPYKPVKFYADHAGIGLNNNILLNKYQPYAGGAGPVQIGTSTVINGLIKLGTSELLEDLKINGAFRISSDLKDNEWLLNFQNYRRRIDWGFTYYRNVQQFYVPAANSGLPTDIFGKTITNLYQGNISYPFDNTKRFQLSVGLRNDKDVFTTQVLSDFGSKLPDNDRRFVLTHAEYVYDNTLNPEKNIWHGMRYKIFFDWNTDVSEERNNEGEFNFNWGADFRYYYPIYRNFIWAGRAAADFSWGSQKTIYYLGGTDSWMFLGSNRKDDGSFRYFDENNRPDPTQNYVYQTLAVNLRGFVQNVANGNNAVVFNSEFRLPVFTTLLDRPINNLFIRNFQLVQFIDMGTAWTGGFENIARPSVTYGSAPVQVVKKAGGIGPFAGGYGFGVRSTLLGYYLKFDAAWTMDGLFKGCPKLYLSMGLDF